MLGGLDLQRHHLAWERFLSAGETEPGVVQDPVARSWERCRKRGQSPWLSDFPVRQDAVELAATRARNRSYIDAALPFMRFLESSVRGTGFILVLADSAGVVLELFGDEDVIVRAAKNNFVPGCCSSEQEMGTNSIGLAMVELKPMQLSGAEHFNVCHHNMACASAPVFAQDGSLLGTVTLRGEAVKAHSHTLGMVIAAAEGIQNRLREQRLEIEKSLSEKMVRSLLGSMSEAIITLDAEGDIVYVNETAEALLGIPEAQLRGRKVTTLFAATELNNITRRNTKLSPFEAAYDAGGRRTYFVITPFVARENEGGFGAILAISRRREFLKNVPGMSGFTARYEFDDIVGRHGSLKRQIDLAEMVAKQDSRVLVTGETGTGKELVAQGIHNASHRANGPFVAINCAAIPRDLIEAELLGYKDGAFTGARRGGQAGKLELADGGTLFLDEISQMPLDMQAKLLRVLQDGIVTRLGDTKPAHVDTRVIAATNENLFEKSNHGDFRKDLYFRLSVVEIFLPPLRERGTDLELLVAMLLRRLDERLDRDRLQIEDEAMNCLRRYEWPGNVRELENVLETAAILCEGGIIRAESLPKRVTNASLVPLPKSDILPSNRNGMERQLANGEALVFAEAENAGSIRDIEADAIRHALREYDCNITKVSRTLGIARSTVYRKMREMGINRTHGIT